MFRVCSQLVGLLLVVMSLCGCGRSARDLALNPDLARESLQKALQAWVDGKKPQDLRPDITIGDQSWASGATLVSFELLTAKESSDGTNLYVPVQCQLKGPGGKVTTTETVYIIGTSPVVTIFPQQI